MSDKKMYLRYHENGGDLDGVVFNDLADLMGHLKYALEDVKEGDDVEFTIEPIWLYEEEFDALPEAQI